MASVSGRIATSGRVAVSNRTAASARVSAATRDNTGALAWVGKGLLAYYRADVANITTIASKVSQWRDISGNNVHMNQATSGRRPTFTASWLNGNGAVTYAGGQVLASVGNIQNKSNPITFGGVFQRTATTGAGIFAPSAGGGCELTANLAAAGNREVQANGVGYIEDGSATLNPELWIASGEINSGNPAITTYAMYVSTSITPQSIASPNAASITPSGNIALIGAITSGALASLTGHIAELFCVDRILTSAEMNAYGVYVLNKYGSI